MFLLIRWFPACLCPFGWAPSPYKSLWIWVKHFFGYWSYIKCSNELNLGEGPCIFTSIHLPDSGLYLLKDFDFDFDLSWMAWYCKSAIASFSLLASVFLIVDSCCYRRILVFIFCLISIRHLHISQNAPYLPPKILHKHCFQFLLERL